MSARAARTMEYGRVAMRPLPLLATLVTSILFSAPCLAEARLGARAIAVGLRGTGQLGDYRLGGFGGQIRLRPMERVALDLFTDHYFGDERGGARHDHEIGATIQYDVLRGDRWAIHPILGACGLLAMAHAPQSDMTATDVRFGLRAGVGAELLVTSRLSLQAQAQVVAYVGHDFAPYAWPGGTADELSVRAVGQFHAAANVWF